MNSFRVSPFRELAGGLGYPEGPVAQPDGSVLLVEIHAGTLTRIEPDGTRCVVAQLGGGPNGAALGPDGALYICNNGGFQWIPVGSLLLSGDATAGYHGGSIQKVKDGRVTTLYTEVEVTNQFTGKPEKHPLCAPDDLEFDSTGHFWFTDWGHTRGRTRDMTGIYYASAGGDSIEERVFPAAAPNGIGLSPDGSRLYVAETYSRRVLYWELDGPGRIRLNPDSFDGSYLLTADIGGILDSMALDEEGNVYVATMLPHGQEAATNGGIAVISPAGEVLEFIEIAIGGPAPLPSNLCFGGADRRTAYITLGGSGRLVACEMRVPGKKLAYG